MTMRAVFIIDDDSDIRELIAQTLSDEGYQVMTCGDGRAALTLIEQHQPALILLDMMMPKMSGWQVMVELKASSYGAHIPVLLVSASRDLDQAARQLGAAGTIAKPFDLDTLINTVADFLGPP